MKLPRDTDAREPIKALQRTGYQSYANSGSHIRLQSGEPKSHSLTIPHHPPSAFAGRGLGSESTFQRPRERVRVGFPAMGVGYTEAQHRSCQTCHAAGRKRGGT
jgi:predicted RNA binding protein YcfA (HicA-like mRNA interferase family)